MNEVRITMTLNKKPELKFTKGGTPLCSLSGQFWKKMGTKKPDGTNEFKPMWLEVVCWGECAEFASQFQNKDKLDVIGKLDFREYTPQGSDKPIQKQIITAFEVQAHMVQTQSGMRPEHSIGKRLDIKPVTIDQTKSLPDWMNYDVDSTIPF